MKRLEHLKFRRPFGTITEDGSGWVSVHGPPKQLNIEDQNSDISPPRKRRGRNDTPSPERNNGDGDLSPPRKQKRCHHTPSPKPDGSTLGQKHLISDDHSAISPPRKRSARSEMPSHKANIRAKQSSPESDISPPRRCHHSQGKDSGTSEFPDISPPRRGQKEQASLEDIKTGLVSGRDIKEMNARTKKDDWLRFKEMDLSVSGRGAEPVYRDKITGARISKEELIKSKEKDEKPKEIKVEWGKGLAQKWDVEARQLELEQGKDKPFARTRQSEKRGLAAELEKRGMAEARNRLRSVDVCCSEDVAGERRKCHLRHR